jgi:mannose-1-phosphate guanylyltransferase
MSTTSGSRSDLWGVVLAGGDGMRLRSLTTRIAGDERPKQFCAIADRETLLDRTRRRLGLAVRDDRQVIVVTANHARYWEPLHRELLPGRLVVQPLNAGTVAGIVYPLLQVQALADDPIVVVTPSDHEVVDERAFMAKVVEAAGLVELLPGRVVVLGIEADDAEPEYGWIEPMRLAPRPGAPRALPVARFVEKPDPAQARALLERGGLWNSFVMVGRAGAFLELVREAVPDVLAQFAALEAVIGSTDEADTARRVYQALAPMGFAERVLTRVLARLLVLPVRAVGWCDWGTPRRVLASLKRRGQEPSWAAMERFASTA